MAQHLFNWIGLTVKVKTSLSTYISHEAAALMIAMSISLSTSLKLALTLAAFFSFLPPTVGLVLSRSGREGKDNEIKINLEEKMVIGSRPPRCRNKCMSCRPCMAAVVVPVHRMKGKAFKPFFTSREEEDSYYLLSWKCRCGNKIYQP